MCLFNELNNSSIIQLLYWWDNTPDWVDADEYELFISEVAASLQRLHPNYFDFLYRHLKSSNISKKRAAFQFIPRCTQGLSDDLIDIYIRAFFENNVLIKTDVLWAFIGNSIYPLTIQQMSEFLNHSDNRFSALVEMYLCYAYPKARSIRIHSCLKSDNAMKRLYACDFIGDEDLIEFKDDLWLLLKDENQEVRECAKINLQLMLGT